MKLIPVVMSFNDRPVPTGAQLHAAARVMANVALGFERLTGKVMEVGAAVPVHITDRPTPYNKTTESIIADVSIYADVQQELNDHGYDTTQDVYAVYLVANARDKSGVGNPTWTQDMYNTGKWGWNARANATAGGVCVMGEAHLRRMLTMPQSIVSKVDRAAYYHAIWHGMHEVGHAIGVHHSGYDPVNYPNGKPNDPALKAASIMAYGPEHFRMGTMTTIGALPEEIDTWSRHVIFKPSPALYLHLYLPDRNAIFNGVDVRTVLGPGLLLEDYSP